MRGWPTAIALLIVAGLALIFLRSGRKAGPTGEPGVLSSTQAQAQASALVRTSTPSQGIATTQALQNPVLESASNISIAQTLVTPGAPAGQAAVNPQGTGAVMQDLPTLPVNTLLENTRTAVRDYGSMFGGNPVGNNAEITRALNGENPKQTRFLSPGTGLKVNGRGELIDPWGTPLFFHQLSANETEIRSAGPDKVLWTSDDVIIR